MIWIFCHCESDPNINLDMHRKWTYAIKRNEFSYNDLWCQKSKKWRFEQVKAGTKKKNFFGPVKITGMIEFMVDDPSSYV